MKIFLVALDASPRATTVLDAAILLARPLGAQLILYRSVGLPPEIPQHFYQLGTGDLETTLIDAAKLELAALTAKVPTGMLADQIVEIASPWDGICRAAKAHKAELIVIGSHGYSGLDRLLGTTAAKVVNHAHCSVCVVRPAAAD